MPQITLTQIVAARQRRDKVSRKIENLKLDLKAAREDLSAAQTDYDRLVKDLCEGQGVLALDDGDGDGDGDGQGDDPNDEDDDQGDPRSARAAQIVNAHLAAVERECLERMVEVSGGKVEGSPIDDASTSSGLPAS
jgi:hypothetical protein